MAVQLLDVQTSSSLVGTERSVASPWVKSHICLSISSLGVKVISQASLVLKAPTSDGCLGLIQLINVIGLLEGVRSVVSALEDFVQNASVVWLVVD